jgi:spermidine dehydrogenase
MSDPDPKSAAPGDTNLGMDEPITRRDFIGSTLIVSGATLLGKIKPADLLASTTTDEFTGYGGVGEYSNSNGNTLAVMQAGHTIRDGIYNSLPSNITDTEEIFDCVMIGGGISGLAAALFFQRLTRTGMSCLVLENHLIFGGEAKQNEFMVDGKRLISHQGSAIYQLMYPNSFFTRFYDSIGLKTPKLQYQTWGGPGPAMPLANNPYDTVGMENGQYGFWFGAKFGHKPGMWVIDPLGSGLKGARRCRETTLFRRRWKATQRRAIWIRSRSNSI